MRRCASGFVVVAARLFFVACLVFVSVGWPAQEQAHAQAQAASGKTRSPQEVQRDQLLRDLGLKKADRPPAASSPPGAAPTEAVPPTSNAAAATDVPAVGGAAGGSESDHKGSAAAAVPSFRRVVHPLLMQTCTPCHAAGGPGAGTRFKLSGEPLADHATVARLVNVRDAATSVLLMKPSGAIHAGGTPWPPGGIAYGRVLAWIQHGARLDGTAAPATTTTPTTPTMTTTPTTVAAGEPAAPARAMAARRSKTDATPASDGNGVVAGTAPPEPPAAPATPAIDFGTAVHPMLISACAGCHGPRGPAAMSRLVLSGDAATDRPVVGGELDLDDPARSLLLTKSAGQLHGGGPVIPVGDARHTLLRAWIDQVAAQRTTASSTAATTTTPTTTPASTPTQLAAVAPMSPTLSPLPTLPGGFALNGRFDVTYERRQFSGDPFAASAVDALRSYHHFLFLTRESTDDPFGLAVEVLSLQFWEVHARLGGLDHGRPWQLLLSAGKILVPFGADPLTHQSYGGLAGFDQRILPTIWAQEGAAAHLTVQRGGLALTDDLYVVRGYALAAGDGVLNLQSDFSPDDNARLGWGNRLGASWLNFSAWYSTYFNALGFDRRLFMQAVDVMIWRPRQIPVLGHFSAGAGFLRADVSGGEATGVGGPGRDYYHFGSYLQLRYHPTDWLYLQYRQGLRTFDNRRGVIIDETRLTAQDGSTHNFGLVARCRGLTLGLYYFINLEKVDEIPDDLLRVSITYDF